MFLTHYATFIFSRVIRRKKSAAVFIDRDKICPAITLFIVQALQCPTFDLCHFSALSRYNKKAQTHVRERPCVWTFSQVVRMSVFAPNGVKA